MIELYDYQKKGIQSIKEKLFIKQKVLYMLPTGGGKTFIFSFLIKDWIHEHEGHILVLCHKEELIHQTVDSLHRIGVSCQAILSRTKRADDDCKVYVGMIETVYNRLSKNNLFFPEIDLIICDECHILIFDKVFSFFPKSKILGCSATPIVQKRVKFYKCIYCRNDYDEPRICCHEAVQEWTKPFAMSLLYNDIILGPKIQDLIEMGKLVKELTFVKEYTDNSNLKTDADGEFTTESTDEVYSDDEAVFNVLLNYKELCEGKKTLIFNSSSKTNLLVYNKFIEAGYVNVRMYDSVNKKESGNRKELVKWFEETSDAILLNVNVFTTGFDSKEIQAIILNRPIGSLSLFLQAVGRGGRTSSSIYKDHFILVDGGGNVERHLEWSDPTRDWERIFWDGIGEIKARKQDPINVQLCDECGFIYSKYEAACPNCGFEIEKTIIIKEDQEKESNLVLKPIRKIPPPNAEKIYQYTKSKGENINFAFKIMISQIVDLFRFYRVSKEKYESSKYKKGELDKKISRMIQRVYFVLLKKEDILTEGRRTLEQLKKRTIEQLDKYYGR